MDSDSRSSISAGNVLNDEARRLKIVKREVDEDKICKGMEYSKEIGEFSDKIPVVGTFISAGIAVINFFTGHSLSSSCEDKPFDEIKQILENRFDKVDKALDKQFKLMKNIYETVSSTRYEIQQGFEQILKSIKSSTVEPLVINLNTFIQSFNSEKDRIKNLPQDQYVAKLKEPENILLQLKSSRYSKENNLHQSLHQIIDGNYAIPEYKNDKTALNALRALIYGTQTYISVMFFLIEQFLYLAHYSYEKRDLDAFNYYYDLVESTFADFKSSLIDQSNTNSLIPKVIGTLDKVKNSYSEDCNEETCQFVSKQIAFLVDILHKLKQMKLPIIDYTPTKYTGKLNFTDIEIKTPIGQWKKDAQVYYALQYENNGIYSKIGDWSNPFTVSDKANPFITLNYDENFPRRLIFRKFNSEAPQLVGIVEDTEQEKLRDINRDLFNAASFSNEDTGMEEMEILLNNGADINAVFEHGRRAIHAATAADNIKLAKKYIFGNGEEDVHVGDENGYTPLHIAAEAGHKDFVTVLMDLKANVNSQTKSDLLTPLHLAAKKGNAKVINLLAKSELLNVNEKEKNGFTPLHSAVTGGITAVQALVAIPNIDINVKSKEGLTPLHLASIKNDPRIAEILSKTERLDVNAGDVNNMTPLHFATMLGNLEMVEYLLGQNDINVNAVSTNNWSTLHFAIFLKRESIVSMLLEIKNIDVNLLTDGNISPLHIAVESGQNSIAKDLMEKGAKIEDQNKEGLTVLHIATKNKNIEMVTELLKKEADIEVKTKNGSTPLHYAAAVGSVEIVQLLLNKSVNVKSVDNSGQAPVHVAVLNGKFQVVKLLINNNRSLLKIKTPFDETLLHLCVKNPKLDIIKFLIDEGIKLSPKNRNLQTPLHLATQTGNLPLVKYLVERKVDVYESDGHRNMAIYMAAQKGHLDIIKYLFEGRKVNPDFRDASRSHTFKDDEALTVMHYILSDAVINGHLDIVKHFEDPKGDGKKEDFKVWCDLLIKAAEYGQLNIVRYFIEVKEMNVDCMDAQNYYPLWLAVDNGHMDVVIYLMEHRAYWDNKSLGDDTPLRRAITQGRLNMVKYLIRKDASIDLPVETEDTILHDAVVYNHFDIVKYLVEELKLEVNAKNIFQDTPLHKAAHLSTKKVFNYLKEHGGDVNAKNFFGKTPVDILYETGKSNFDRRIRDIQGNSKVDIQYPLRNLLEKDKSLLDHENGEKSHWKSDFAPEVVNIVKGISQQPLMRLEDATGTHPLGEMSVRNANFNSTLLLLDLFVRKVTGEKY